MPPIGPVTPMPGGQAGPGGFDPSQLPGVMQAMQDLQGAAQKLASGLPPLSPFIAQFLSQLGQAVPNVIMAAGGGPGAPPPGSAPGSPGGAPGAGGAGGGPQGMGVGAPPMPPG
jgi:hypothetical protein